MFRLKSITYFLISFTIILVDQTYTVDERFLVNYIDYFKNVNFSKSANLTEECKNSINGSKFLETKMFDASSKIPVGVYETALHDLGNFDECYDYSSTSGKMFYGKYCLGKMDMNISDPSEKPAIFQEQGQQLYSGFCLPNTCTVLDFKTLYNQHHFTEVSCSSRADLRGYTFWFKLTISILCIMVTMVSVATIYDWLTDPKTKNLFKQISAIKTCNTLFSTQTNANDFTSLYGLRCITMAWILLHHTYLVYFRMALNNENTYNEIIVKPENIYITYGSFSVITFFTIGAVLTSYNFLKHYEERDFSVTWNYCIRRYVRLTPPLAVMILIDASMYELGSGPLWYKTLAYLSQPCREYWWSTLFYVQNYINANGDCIPQAWFLAVDMQCYIIFSVLLLILSKRRWCMVLVLLVLLAISAIVVFFVLHTYHFFLYSTDPSFETQFYKPTHVRYGAYVAGLLFGICLHEIKSKTIVIPKIYKVLITFCVAMVMCGILGIGYLVLEDFLGFPLLMAIKEVTWTGMIGVVILMCESGNADFVKRFLSLPFFKILTKLTYGMYLVGLTVSYTRITSARVSQDVTLYSLYLAFFSDFVTSLIASFILYVFIEVPFAHIGNYILVKIRGYQKTCGSSNGLV